MHMLLLLSVFLFFTSSVESVCNRTVLWNVTVLGHYDRGERAQKFTRMNVFNLNNYYKLDIQWANISTVCEGMFHNFPRLKTLSMINLNISEVENDAFHLPSLERLSLALNNLTYVRRGQYNYIKTLKNLYLSANKINYVEGDAFDDMPWLQRVYLDRNRIKEINGNWFLNSPQIRSVHLSHNNITFVPANAFRHLLPNHQDLLEYFLDHNQIVDISEYAIDNSLQMVLHLENNSLSYISGRVFTNLRSVYRLHLEKNNITCLEDDVLQQMNSTIMSLYLNKNPLSCECVEKFDDLVDRKLFTVDFYYDTVLPCARKTSLKQLNGYNPYGF